MSADFRKRRAAAKGNLTKLLSQISTQEAVEPGKRDLVTLQHLMDLLQRAEDAYATLFGQLEEVCPEDESQQREETGHYHDFTLAADNARLRINAMIAQRKSLQLYDSLSGEVTDWEESSPDELTESFLDEYPALMQSLAEFRASSCATGATDLPILKAYVKDLRRRLTKLKQSAKPEPSETATMPEEEPKGFYRQEMKARSVPLPIFKGDLADWRSFWTRFQEYISKLKHASDYDKLSYLQDCVKDSAALEIVEDAARNGDSFEAVGKRLNQKYDQPREVFSEALKGLMDMPTVAYTKAGLSQLAKDLNRFRNILLRYGDGTADQIFTAIMETRMSPRLLEEWKLHNGSNTAVPPAKELVEFCDKRELVLSSTEGERRRDIKQPSKSSAKPNFGAPQGKRYSKPQVSLHSHVVSNCRHCQNGEHQLHQCPAFRDLDSAAKQQVVQTLRACYNCLSLEHAQAQCPSKRNCRECHRRHHTLLHRPSNDTRPRASTPPPATPAPRASSLTVAVPDKTALVWSCQVLLEVNGRQQQVRAMIDPGSTLSFLTGKVASALKAKRIPFTTTITGLEQSHAATSMFKVDLTLRARDRPDEPPIELSPSIVTSITGNTPSNDLTKHKDLDFTKNLKLADPSFGSPGRIDLLLGQDAMHKIMRGGVVNSPTSSLYCINTVFGWVVGGRCDSSTQAVTAHICCRASVDTTTNNLLEAFWKSEEPPSDSNRLSPEEETAVTYFKDTVIREPDGRYQVSLPKRESAPPLGHSRSQAIKRYEQNERSLKRRGRWQEFKTAVEEYSALGHAELVPASDLDKDESQTFYMPMHGVVKEASTSTRLRVVFDASAKTSTGHSLNDTLLPGPTLYPLLTNILIRFRQSAIGMSSDISKMFREVSLHPNDRDLHRYVMKDESGQIQDWRMTRVTFGVTSSPFLATQVLRQLALDHQKEFPEAAELILTSFYVDDCLTGADDLQGATKIREALNHLLSKAKMTLRKWRSNSKELKASIPEELLEKEGFQLISAPAACHKALGVHWDTALDSLHVATPVLNETNVPTKRQVLSDVARTFDVLGWFSPVTVFLKILLQRVWHLGLEWDQLLPPELAEIWKTWRGELASLTAFPIPRHYYQKGKQKFSVQLHGFCDASQVAFAGAVYLRTTYTDTTVSTTLVMAKARVAPVKPTTIPKLELCAAVLLSKLLALVRVELNIELHDVYAWSDSTITLGWIRTSPHRLKTYVANRVVAITDRIPPINWRHVISADNPADIGSRGSTVKTLLQSTLWWSGPPWLAQGPEHWPPQTQPPQTTALPELKVTSLTIKATTAQEDFTDRYSDYVRLVHVLAWILRFVANTRKKPPERMSPSHLTVQEVSEAEILLYKRHQSQFLSKEQTALKSGKTVSASSPLCALHPFMDPSGIIRVGGRLTHSDLSYSQRHPVILHRRSHLAQLLVRHLHEKHLHAGPTLLMSLLSRDYYILGARQLVRGVSRLCISCRKTYARTGTQLMGDLPPARVKPAPTFAKVGVDFAGPVTLKKGHTRKPIHVKAYICLFVCLATKAVHLELVADLSTSAFLAAFRRFTARRGCPSEIFSDNGTNFIGANRELKELYDLMDREDSRQEMMEFFTKQRVIWTFIPGRAPHFGGLWEAAVKSAKSLLRKLLGTQTLTVEEYASVLTDVEATLNSRPLCPLDTLPEDGLEVLTPGHFLIGRPLTALPQQPLEILSLPSRKRWNLCQQISTEFWQRWSQEYLSTLQRRNKWRRQQRDFAIGDIVLVKDQELFTRTWPIALITALHPGPDGHVQAVTLRTSKGVYIRPIVKLVLLLDQEPDKGTDQEKDPSCR